MGLGGYDINGMGSLKKYISPMTVADTYSYHHSAYLILYLFFNFQLFTFLIW